MKTEKRYIRRHNRIEKKWRKLKDRVHCCEQCGEIRIGLNHSWARYYQKFFLECEYCHRCGKSKPTIRAAIREWNKSDPEID
jgi:hypothetical protein